jgi:hypothetical protein
MTDEDSPPLIRYSEWQAEYQAAIIELDRGLLAERVAEAEAAIAKRLRAISQSADHHAESQAIADALRALRVLKQEL